LKSDSISPVHTSSESVVSAKPKTERETTKKESAPIKKYDSITSPLVGKFYMCPQPGKPAFVKPGDTVKAGQKVCIIEAMKLINEITAPKDCKIVNLLVQDGAGVEKGQALIEIE
jgi:acetyl-CoA carboxylase biotin carboxyl carrier protein